MRKIIMPTALALTLAALTGCDKTGAENQQTLLKYLEKQGELQKSISQTQETLVSLGRENAELRKDLLAVQEKLKGPVNTDTLKSIDGAIQISTCPDPRIRKTVCTILGQFAGPQAEARLVELTNKDADAQVRVSALTSLSEMSSSKLPTVLPSKLSSDSGEERVVAVNLMLKAPKPEYKAALLAMLAEVPSGDNNWSIQSARAAAYRAVRTLVGPSDFASLKSACQRDKGEAKRAALSTLLVY